MIRALDAPVIQKIAEIAQGENIPSYVIGGYVRDFLLQRSGKDIDIVSVGNGSGIHLAEMLQKSLGKKAKLSIFKNFGTAMVKFKQMEIEFVGARKESYQRNSRKPIVEEGSLEDDQKRRDFTINALAISLNKEDYGQLIDPFSGIEDLSNKILRTPLDPDITFSDDPLRIMRAIRFATQLDFQIEASAWEAILRNKQRLEIVSKERIVVELHKIIASQHPSKGIYLLDESGILEMLLPELTALKGVEIKKGIAHKDNFIHSIQVLENISQATGNIWLRWAALLHDIGKAQTKKFEEGSGWTFHGHDFVGGKMILPLFKRLKLPRNEKMKYVQKLVRLHLRPIALVENIVTDSAIRRLLMDANEDVEDLMLLCKADITSKNQQKVVRFIKNFELVEKKLKEVEERDRIRNWQPPIDGTLIMKVFDIAPGREIGMIKKALKEAILEGKIKNNYADAYDFMIEKGKEFGFVEKNNLRII
jgi:poly(A) polymerase